MRLLGYIRVSTDEQGNSIADQERLIKQYCAMYEHDLTCVITDENVSAGVTLEQRPGGKALMKTLEQGLFDGIVVKELDRAFRLAIDGLKTVDWFNARGLHIHTVYDRIDTSHPDGWGSLALKLVMGEWERRKIQHRTKITMDGLRKAGKKFGAVPYGLVEVDGFLYCDPETWPVRQSIVEQGATRTGAVMQQIVDWLELGGIPAPGGKGKGGKEVGGVRWHKSTVSRIIKTHPDLEHIPPLSDAPESTISE